MSSRSRASMWMSPRAARFVVLALVVWAASAAMGVAQPAADCGPTPYDCAVAEVQRREFPAAIRTLEQVLAQAPRDLRALNLLGIALTGAGKPDEANVRFREALAIDARFTPARKNLAINEFNLGRLTDAQRHLEEVLKQTPDDEVAHLHVGEIEFQRKQLGAALTHYEKARARIPQNTRWVLHYAACLLDAKRQAEAVALLDRLPQDDPAGLFDAGVTLGQFGAHADAARFFAAARKAGYTDAYAAGYNQALMLIDAADYDAAIRIAEELLAQVQAETHAPPPTPQAHAQGHARAPGQRQASKPAELYSLISNAYAKTNRIKEAYDALREATRLEPDAAEHYIDLAMLCLEHENYDLGLEIVDVGLKHRPDSSMLYLQRGVVLAMKGSVEQAEQEFERASKANPDDASPWVALAMVWMQTGRASKAVETLRARTHARAPHPVLFYALGIALVRSGAAPDDAAGNEATKAFRTAVRLSPTFGPAQAELGKLLLKRGDVGGAIAHLERAIALEPDNAAPAYVLAQAYRRGGQTDHARDLLARVSKLNAQERGDDPDTDLKRVIVRIVREGAASGAATNTGVTRTGAAADAAGTSAGVIDADVEARYARGTACVAAGDIDGAIAQLRQVIEASPAFAEARYNLGLALYNRFEHPVTAPRKEDLDEAIAQLKKAVEREPTRASFQLLLGELLAEQQNLVPAIDHLRRALALAPTDPEYAFNLGLALRLRGDLDAAEAQFRAALARNADHALARRSLGLVLRQKGEASAAVAELRRAVALLPDDAQGHHLLGSALSKLGDQGGAIAELRQATRLDPSLIEARVTLAQVLAKGGQKDEALKEQAEVQRLNAEKADFGRMLVLLDSSAELLKKGDVATAIAQRREAVALSPSFAEAHYQLALVLRTASGTGARDRAAYAEAEAEAELRRAIALDPRHARAFAELGRLLDARGDKAGAEEARQHAAALAPCS